jgi:ribonucleoside-diphosphate reductase alpha chain
LGRGISEGKTDAVSKGLTRGASPVKLVSRATGNEPKGFAGGSAGARTAPTAFSGSNVLALKPASDEAVAYKRDYEERAKELAEDIAFEEIVDAASTDATAALFTDAAANEAAEAKKLAADRRAKSLLQGYTGNSCSECQNFTMVRNGTCEKCDTCGATSGCS